MRARVLRGRPRYLNPEGFIQGHPCLQETSHALHIWDDFTHTFRISIRISAYFHTHLVASGTAWVTLLSSLVDTPPNYINCHGLQNAGPTQCNIQVDCCTAHTGSGCFCAPSQLLLPCKSHWSTRTEDAHTCVYKSPGSLASRTFPFLTDACRASCSAFFLSCRFFGRGPSSSMSNRIWDNKKSRIDLCSEEFSHADHN